LTLRRFRYRRSLVERIETRMQEKGGKSEGTLNVPNPVGQLKCRVFAPVAESDHCSS